MVLRHGVPVKLERLPSAVALKIVTQQPARAGTCGADGARPSHAAKRSIRDCNVDAAETRSKQGRLRAGPKWTRRDKLLTRGLAESGRATSSRQGCSAFGIAKTIAPVRRPGDGWLVVQLKEDLS